MKGDMIGQFGKLKAWKGKNGWCAKINLPVAVFGCKSQAQALKALDKLVREMADCDKTCGCPPIYEKRKK